MASRAVVIGFGFLVFGVVLALAALPFGFSGDELAYGAIGSGLVGLLGVILGAGKA